ncbi:hypothetical protein CEXT_798061 [Caerostris extrusa]|uniref:Uncharacterized protein n=1 Tax=Caerostris extrusa TaxID=172846 RepID=A0AAV4V8N7_CAEEX|nr:hypothetical protein CEXT_798061 [Caerostris extrusa]
MTIEQKKEFLNVCNLEFRIRITIRIKGGEEWSVMKNKGNEVHGVKGGRKKVSDLNASIYGTTLVYDSEQPGRLAEFTAILNLSHLLSDVPATNGPCNANLHYLDIHSCLLWLTALERTFYKRKVGTIYKPIFFVTSVHKSRRLFELDIWESQREIYQEERPNKIEPSEEGEDSRTETKFQLSRHGSFVEEKISPNDAYLHALQLSGLPFLFLGVLLRNSLFTTRNSQGDIKKKDQIKSNLQKREKDSSRNRKFQLSRHGSFVEEKISSQRCITPFTSTTPSYFSVSYYVTACLRLGTAREKREKDSSRNKEFQLSRHGSFVEEKISSQQCIALCTSTTLSYISVSYYVAACLRLGTAREDGGIHGHFESEPSTFRYSCATNGP